VKKLEPKTWHLEPDTPMPPGFVSLVGAGPGDPRLLTVKAVQQLEAADLVLYDALVAPAAVACATRAQRFCVGKRAGRKSVDQDTICRLMIRGARQGKRVVRLKCGDPFVLGRGGEEVLALRAAGIAFEVVPGVTSALAAPALAGVPVTHRGLASGFVVVSGHSASAYRPMLGAVRPHSLTLVVLMGIRERAGVAAYLLELGWRADTPAAIITGAATESMGTWLGPLEALGTARVDGRGEAPGTIVVGEVVSLAAGAETNRTLERAIEEIAVGR
jgi:uroporphyrin-III C-methyltransferase